jgi:hypothetical protein
MDLKSGTNQYEKFSDALRKVLRVTHEEMKEKLKAKKRARKPKPTTLPNPGD